MSDRTLRLGLIALALLAPMVANAQQCEGKSYTITFSEFPVGTSIGSQYAAQGVGFAYGALIANDGSNPTSPVLSGTPQFQGPITAAFVDPATPSVNVAASNVSFVAGYFDQTGSTQVTFLDTNNQVIGTQTNSTTGLQTFTAPAGTHAFTVSSGSDTNGFAIDTLAYTLGTSALKIASPARDDASTLSLNSHTRTPDVTFQAAGSGASGSVNWNVTLDYDTDTPRGGLHQQSILTTSGTAQGKLYFDGQGGRLTVDASNGTGDSACTLQYAYIVGEPIPEAEITTMLVRLYTFGATPRLLTGIADKESTYRQFGLRTKYGKQAYWPLESAEDGGSHIGLMQLSSTGEQGVANAWNWIQNAQHAAGLFREKLSIARSLETRIRQAHPGLRALTDLERENMALTLYGPGALPGQDNQYYRAVAAGSGYQWVTNTANNPRGVAYADDVRSRVR